jgi:GLPGLI family protein
MTKKLTILILLFLMACALEGQINYAKITFERKTNLYKKFKDNNVEDWMKEEDKIKIDFFELFVTDTFSLFRPQESDLREQMSWATSKTSVYQDFNLKKRYTIKFIWQEEIHMIDTLRYRNWQITESTRKIAGYLCRKAIWKANDTTKIYAWFSYDIVPSTGPESFNGLPGTILGLATEDGGVVYFAKKVELIKPEPSLFILPKKKKISVEKELLADLTKRYGKEKWFKRMLMSNFGVW